MTPVCRLCKGTGLVESEDENGEYVTRQCLCKTQRLHTLRTERWRKKLGVWPLERQFGFAKYQGERSKPCVELLENYVNNFNEYKTCSIYVYGPTGTQKTTVLQWVAFQLVEKGIHAKWASMPTLLQKLTTQSSFHSDAERVKLEKEIAEYMDPDVLILDESFDKSKGVVWGSGTQVALIDSFLRTRLQEKGKPCIFISNVAPDSIETGFDSQYLGALVRRNLSATLEFVDPVDTNLFAGKPDLWKFQRPNL